jgi:hypothetical protein
LHTGLKKNGVDSKMLCVAGSDPENDMFPIRPPRLENRIAPIKKRLMTNLGLSGNFGFRAETIMAQQAFKNCDVININRYFEVFSYLALPALTRFKPTVLNGLNHS